VKVLLQVTYIMIYTLCTDGCVVNKNVMTCKSSRVNLCELSSVTNVPGLNKAKDLTLINSQSTLAS